MDIQMSHMIVVKPKIHVLIITSAKRNIFFKFQDRLSAHGKEASRGKETAKTQNEYREPKNEGCSSGNP